MKALNLIAAFVLCTLPAFAESVHIATPNTSMVLDATRGKHLKNIYYGSRLDDALASDVKALKSSGLSAMEAYPQYGLMNNREAAIGVIHADGSMTLDMIVDAVKESTDKKTGAKTVTVTLKDSYYPFTVDVNYRTYPALDVIETWTAITNGEKETVRLQQFDSGYLPVRRGDVWLSHLYGAQLNEGHLTHEPLTPGMKVIVNRDGIRNSHTAHSEIMLSLDGKPRENEGRVIGAALCYSGNYKLRIDTDQHAWHHVFAGIDPDNSEYILSPGETFVTPELALTYSTEGTGGASRNYHRWARSHKFAHADVPRKVLLNSWEGVYFNIDEDGMTRMIKDMADLGGELFVMDDGWFGDKYPRNNSKGSLGDWVVDTRKLPHGIQGLIDTAKANGIEFGIWIEPEMTNVQSELYEKHPDWVLKPLNHKTVYGRGGGQMILDLANPEVQEHVFTIVDTLLTKYPGIDYIKWDANMAVRNHGSQYLAPDRQSHLYIEYHKGLRKVLERIRAKYPDVTIQNCASGGGRANYGLMPYFDEFWVSDNTDAKQRVWLQWGDSYFFPPTLMASHISASPDHHSYRFAPMKYRIDVAMSGRLGVEMQPAQMTPEERKMVRNAIAEYKQYVRPVLIDGDIYRLLAPEEGHNAASLMYVTPQKDRAVFYWWKLEQYQNQHAPRVRMAGLDPERKYVIRELNRIDSKPLSFEGKAFSGKFLMDNGLEIPYGYNVPKDDRNDFGSRVLYLEAQ
ncbi:MAG: alpha-galactosidase [Muribaculaceae bacterium]